ncbi:uracil-DNA glycosylase isoform X2 [Erinaceus europaeus]|uniref:Uracil-DNA glycosylase isoform X2 n=1 Tax=Erinaceus europaeus TaxID=9365 RepID=A0ABM3XJF5_ERIEU|nr:uracil-DNA glycosylase isoform X2 [Erinaceus europaeus]
MIGQKTLYSFFSPSPAGKRRSRSPEPADVGTGVATLTEASPAKKARAEPAEPGEPPAAPLSPEQLGRMQRNKAAALLRLAARNAPSGLGDSWKQPLHAEFGKPYFIKLMGFVAEERRHHTVYPPPHQVFTWTQMCDIKDFGKHLQRAVHRHRRLCSSWPRRPVRVGQARRPPPQRRPHRTSPSGQLPQGAGLGAVHRCRGLVAQPARARPGLPALGLLRAEEGQRHRPEASPRAADGPPLPAVRIPRLLRMQAFLEDQRAAVQVRQGAHQLEGPVTESRRGVGVGGSPRGVCQVVRPG